MRKRLGGSVLMDSQGAEGHALEEWGVQFEPSLLLSEGNTSREVIVLPRPQMLSSD